MHNIYECHNKIPGCLKHIPKNGRTKATSRVDTTSPVLNNMEHQTLSPVSWGSSSSRDLATGFSNNAYLFLAKDTRMMLKQKGAI